MKLIIAGGRNYQLSKADMRQLDLIHFRYGVKEVVSGGARGADRGGEVWAQAVGIPVKVFKPDWRFGLHANPTHNFAMAAYADACVLFPGGKDTKDMFEQAKELGLTIFDFRETR